MKHIWLLAILCPLMAEAGNTYGNLPLSFELNQGQTDARVKFLARVPDFTLFVTSDEAVFAGRDGLVQRMKWIGASRKMRVEPLEKQPGISNYFIGNDPSKWRTNIPNYGRFALRGVYPGIDLIFYTRDRRLEYDWVVAPGADPKQIRMKWDGVGEITQNAGGDVVLNAALRQTKPVILQEGRGVEGDYVVRGKEVGFELAKYDANQPLVIDPVFFYSTYLGGALDDKTHGIRLDSTGNNYITGQTFSVNFPTATPLQANSGGGGYDAFVTKVNAAGTALIYSTYLGGSGSDFASGIAVGAAGNVYVTGFTASTDFPVTTPTHLGGTWDAFVTKINSTGSAFGYSTYLGSTGDDFGVGVAVDSSGNAYVSGYTTSTTFPTANPIQATYGGGIHDGFVTKINAAGSALVYSTYLGGSGDDYSFGISVDSAGNAYIAGYTSSADFPTSSPMQGTYGGGAWDGFVTKINSAGSAFAYSTYLGGSGDDQGFGIAVDAATGTAYVTGWTSSSNFPTMNPLQATYGGGAADAFVTKINGSGSAFLYSTYLGGSGTGGDQGYAIAADGAGNAYVTGYTSSTNFPTASPLQATNGGGVRDAFVTKVNSAGSALVYSTYLGGNSDEIGQGIAVDGSGNAHVSGYTLSANLPTTNPLQASNGGTNDVFLSLISGNGAVGAFRDSSGGIELTSELSTLLSSSGGAFASDPAMAQNSEGDTFVVARDAFNAIWVNVYDAETRVWDGWIAAGGSVHGIPAIAVIGNIATIAARDASNAYWTITYTRGSGFSAWSARGGNFATDPSIAASSTTVYFTGKDASNSIWTATLTGGTFSSWQFDGAAAAGRPALTVGLDGSAYIVIRDPSTATWMGRQNGATFNGWQPGGGSVASDPEVAGAGGRIYAVALTNSGVPWYNTFTEGTGNNWTGWQSPGGVLMDVAAAAGSGPQLFLTGRDSVNQLWWYETPGAGWRYVGAGGLAAGPLSAAPR